MSRASRSRTVAILRPVSTCPPLSEDHDTPAGCVDYHDGDTRMPILARRRRGDLARWRVFRQPLIPCSGVSLRGHPHRRVQAGTFATGARRDSLNCFLPTPTSPEDPVSSMHANPSSVEMCRRLQNQSFAYVIRRCPGRFPAVASLGRSRITGWVGDDQVEPRRSHPSEPIAQEPGHIRDADSDVRSPQQVGARSDSRSTPVADRAMTRRGLSACTAAAAAEVPEPFPSGPRTVNSLSPRVTSPERGRATS